MNEKIVITAIGALWTDNFGDVLLGKLFSYSLSDCRVSIISPSWLHKAFQTEAGFSKGGIRDIYNSKCAIFIGGGYFSEPPQNIHKWAVSRYMRIFVWGDIFRIMRKRYSIIGIGAGPCDSPFTRMFVRRLCNGAERVIVRDEASKKSLIAIGVRKEISVAADHALTIEPAPMLGGDGKRSVGLHLSRKVPSLIDASIDLAGSLFKDQEIWFIEDHPGEYEKIKESNPRIVDIFESRVITYKTCDQFIKDLSRMDFILTSKLHVGIVGSALGKKICSVPYHLKVRRFYGDIGRPELCYSGDVSDKNEIAGHVRRCFLSEPVVISEEIRERSRGIGFFINEAIVSFLESTR